MFLFSWKKIYKISGGQVQPIYLIIKMLVNKEVPKNKYDPIYKYYDKNYLGHSFLVNPQGLLDNYFKYTMKEVVEYIALASYRSYTDYIMYRTTTLKVLNSPLPLHKLKQNRLLDIQDDTIHFLYEEVNIKEK
jgi:hypothetical protein